MIVSDGEAVETAPIIGIVHALHFPDRSARGAGELAVLDPLPWCAGGLSERIGGDRVRLVLLACAAIGAHRALECITGPALRLCLVYHDPFTIAVDSARCG